MRQRKRGGTTGGKRRREEDESRDRSPGRRSGEPRDLESRTEELPLGRTSGQGSPHRAAARGRTVSVEGRTDADFDGGSFETRGGSVTPAESCEACADDDPCVRVTADLVSRFSVSTRVTLPSAADHSDLNDCERGRLQTAIDTILAPHEQQHVDAFKTYDGGVTQQIELTSCRSEAESLLASRAQALHDAEAERRETAARAASAALDPFNVTIDLDCEEEEEEKDEESDGESEGTTGEPEE